METHQKNIVKVLFPTFLVLILIGLAILTLWNPAWLGNILRTSQTASAAASLLTNETYAIVADTWTNSLNAGLETAITGAVCYTTPPTTAPISINGVTITPLSEATVPCSAQVGLDQAAALAALNGQSCTSIGTNVTLDAITIGSNPPGTFPPGCYSSSGSMDITLSTTVTLDATAPDGDGGNVWIFRSGGALTTGANSIVALANGANAANVYWTPGGTASLGANSATSPTPTFVGTIIADALGSTGITLGHFANLLGRVLAFGHTVTTDSNTIIVPPSVPASATLHIIKSVINVSGTAVASDFVVHVISATSTLEVAGSPQAGVATPGTLYTLPAGAYIVSEDANPSFPTYTQTFGLDCVGGSFTLAPGEDKICTVINTDIPAQAVSGGGGGNSSPIPLIALTKIPEPLALPGGAGSVTYTYHAKNIGIVPMSDVSVKDDKCSSITYVSGDGDNDSVLDTNEIWEYQCATVISGTETNTAIARGYANDTYAYAVALATVVVGVPGLPDTGAIPPLIDIVKVPSRLTPFPFGGGPVTYTYTVTNPGVVPLSNVAVTDDKCASVSRVSGDSNGDTLLDINEAWIYTCQTNIPISTTNVATAAGRANDIIALDYAFATVLVSTPLLPNTGLPTGGLRLEIPKINVDAAVESVGLTSGGAVDVPRQPLNAAWFNLSAPPGKKGTTVIDGHFGWKNDMPAVFDNLSQLQKGDKVYVHDGKGATTSFVVREVRTYGEHEDASEVFASNDGEAHLTLITCAGMWNATEKSYSERFVVLADKE